MGNAWVYAVTTFTTLTWRVIALAKAVHDGNIRPVVLRSRVKYVIHSPSTSTSQWRHDGRDGVSNHQHYDCLLSRLFRRRSKKVAKLRVTGLCARNSPVTGEFPAQRDSNAENVSIWWRHHVSSASHPPPVWDYHTCSSNQWQGTWAYLTSCDVGLR